MKGFLLAIFISFPMIGLCQSYVFCPEMKTEERSVIESIAISIVFKDSRIYAQELKEKCTKDKIYSQFVSYIQETYPNIKITTLDESKYNDIPDARRVTIKINFLKYDVTFYAGAYVANTKYEVIIYDYRKGETIIRDIVSGEARQVNALGLKSAKIALNNSFKRGFINFVLLIDKLTI